MTSVLTHYLTFTSSQKPTVGDTKLSLVGADHLGWLLCDGRTLNISDYYYLHEVIGTTYGSNASTTFNLPNPAGRVLGVIGSGLGLTPRVAGSNVGAETHTLTIAEMPTHNHPGSSNNTATTGVTDPGHNHSYVNQPNHTGVSGAAVLTTDVADNVNVGATTGTTSVVLTDPGHTHTLVMSNQGGSNAHNNMQPTLFIGNMFIFSGKISGKYPSAGNGMNYPFTGNGIY
jgi:microcystin-dependent protein